MMEMDLTEWAAACDSFFESTERNASIMAAYRVLAELLPESDNSPELWEQAVQA